MDYLLMIIGLLLLIGGADGLVKGAARLAERMGIPSLVIGLTVVAFGTSAPELAVSIRAVLTGQREMAMANVVGSNIFNVLFILGLSAMIIPLTISRQLIRQDVPVMILTSALVLSMAIDGQLSRGNSAVLVVLLMGYTVFLFVQGKRTEHLKTPVSNRDAGTEPTENMSPVWHSILWLAVGLSCLILGANVLVGSAVNIARVFEISEAVIGLTILAIGTSLPEVVTSIVASLRGQRDIAVGNVVGSNTFNLLAVLGISGLVSEQGLTGSLQLVQQDFPIMLAVALLCLPFFFTGASLSRVEGGLFFSLYLLYSAFLIGMTTQAQWLSPLKLFICYFCVPVTVLTVTGSLIRDLRKRR
ncbi:calcium/sodium antiporter [Photobacterium atrarenae]|uniref:Calcium/sodium antiporter n=1 Tax=Photobacterium atrarenae TaxID=865757 RepID=A0ABY5GMY7_9GAMM|nr:calcium/sodium antiporter [Photobacterium atrarenae]UTV29668.1 calcium/sodium antiporter [Photobacterium atrarenae]